MSIEVKVLIVLSLLLVASNIVLVSLFLRRRESGSLEGIAKRLDQLDNLTRLFLVPHTRGGVGETLLAELLHTWLPEPAYDLQFRFASGTIVDAVVRLGDHLVPVDAKFPLEQVREVLENEPEADIPNRVKRAFMSHIEDIASKYVRPNEGTLEFALMYIPSEAMYYRAFVDGDGSLMRDSVERGVVPVGPSNLFLYLQTVAFGLRGLRLNTHQRELIDIIAQLMRDFREVSKSVETTATHLRNAQKNSDELLSAMRRFGALLDRLGVYDGSNIE